MIATMSLNADKRQSAENLTHYPVLGTPSSGRMGVGEKGDLIGRGPVCRVVARERRDCHSNQEKEREEAAAPDLGPG